MGAPILIVAPDGRVVAAPRLSTITREVGGVLVTTLDPAKLKPGWSVYAPPAAPVIVEQVAADPPVVPDAIEPLVEQPEQAPISYARKGR
jgi:hypothetical protein